MLCPGSDLQRMARHAVIVAYPGQGHINPMVQLAFRLCDLDKSLTVTLALARRYLDNILRTWQQSGKSPASFAPNLRLRAICDDVLPVRSMENILNFVAGCHQLKDPFLELARSMEAQDGGKISCIISDTVLRWVPEAAQEIRAQWIAFFPLPVSSLLAWITLDQTTDQDEDGLVRVPGLRLIPNAGDLPTRFPGVEQLKETLMTRAAWIIVNSCARLESTEISAARELLGREYLLPVGPLQPREIFDGSSEVITGALLEEETSSISWLDGGEPASTLYVSFGSIVSITLANTSKLVEALVDSGERFLWVLRKDFIPGTTEAEFDKLVALASQSGRGYVVPWAPQLKVLRHPSVAAFLTHCGWNSTFESICAGVPMLTWPCFADQHLNARYIEDVWKVGVRISPGMDMGNVVKGVMRNRDLRERAARLGEECRADFKADSNQQLRMLVHNI